MTTRTDVSLEAVIKAVDGKRHGNHWMGRCPCHEDDTRSLSISRGKKQSVIVTCHAGCDTQDINAELTKRGAPIFNGANGGGRRHSNVVEKYDYHDEAGNVVSRAVRLAPKGFYQQSPDGNGGWRNSMKGARVVAYNVPEVLEAIAQGRPVFAVEGEKDADNLARLSIVATCNAGGAGKWKDEHSQFLKDADVIILPDNDEPGRKHAQSVARLSHGIASRIRILELPGLKEKGDISNWIADGGTADQLWALVDEAPEWTPLAAAPPPAADRKTVRRVHWKVEPWHEPVDTAELLNSLEAVFLRYIVLPAHATKVLALWILHAWTIDAVDISPYLIIVSPTKQCGKTTLLILIYWLTPRSVLASNISGPAAYRFIEDEMPTLIVDEADSFVKEDDNMRGILNSGHTKPAAFVIRCEGEGSKQQPREFSTWCPKVLASIGALADTLMDRSFRIRMRRKTRGEKVQRRPLRDKPELAELRQKVRRWADDNMAALETAEPNMPDELFNRLGDNWEPLLAIAELAGDDWWKAAHRAALALTSKSDEGDRKVELLSDIRNIFEKDRAEWLGSEVLVGKLVDLPETPWAEWTRTGKALSSRGVASMLKEFDIKSKHERDGRKYYRKDFEEAWDSYLPSFPLSGGN